MEAQRRCLAGLSPFRGWAVEQGLEPGASDFLPCLIFLHPLMCGVFEDSFLWPTGVHAAVVISAVDVCLSEGVLKTEADQVLPQVFHLLPLQPFLKSALGILVGSQHCPQFPPSSPLCPPGAVPG